MDQLRVVGNKSCPKIHTTPSKFAPYTGLSHDSVQVRPRHPPAGEVVETLSRRHRARRDDRVDKNTCPTRRSRWARGLHHKIHCKTAEREMHTTRYLHEQHLTKLTSTVRMFINVYSSGQISCMLGYSTSTHTRPSGPSWK